MKLLRLVLLLLWEVDTVMSRTGVTVIRWEGRAVQEVSCQVGNDLRIEGGCYATKQ